MNRIAVIGIQGAGKSTFANKLGKLLNREVIYLDKEYHLPNWQKKYTSDGWINFQKDIVSKKSWIIDGNYKSTLDLRLEAADTIIFFDFPKWLCIYRSVKRGLSTKAAFDKPEGMKEQISLNLIKYILTYNRNEILEKLRHYEKTKKIFIFRNNKDVENYLRLHTAPV